MPQSRPDHGLGETDSKSARHERVKKCVLVSPMGVVLVSRLKRFLGEKRRRRVRNASVRAWSWRTVGDRRHGGADLG